MDIGIIGATGNIGQRVVREALGRGHRVTGFTRDPAKLEEADPNISWKAIDVLDADSVRRAIGGLDVLISLYQPGNASRADPLVQVDYARVVDLDIGAGKSDNLRDQSGHHFGARIHHPLVFIKLEHEPHPRALSGGSTMRSKQSNGGGRVSVRVESS